MRQFVQISNLSPEVNTYHMTVVLPVTANGTYPLIIKSGLRARVVGASYRTNSGTCVIAFQIGGTNVPSMSSLNCQTAVNTQVSSGNNDTNILDFTESLDLVVSSASSLVWVYVTLYLRQIASTGGYDGGANDDPQGCDYAFTNVQGTGNPPNPGSGGGGETGVAVSTIIPTVSEY